MEAFVPFIWPALGILVGLNALTFWLIPRDFSGNDGCADDRKWPIE